MFECPRQLGLNVSVRSHTRPTDRRTTKTDAYQEVDGVVGSHLTALNEPLGERRHHVLHQVVPQRYRLCF